MERWYPDRIGGMFTANAEAVADYALRRPVARAGDVVMSLENIGHPRASKAEISLNGKKIDGYIKSALQPRCVGRQILMAHLATLLGAPSAPYIFMPDADFLYSPICVEQPAGLEDGWDEKDATTHAVYSNLNPESLGAAAQFRFWINERDGEHNTIKCKSSGKIYMIDHEGADPSIDIVALSTEQFASESFAQQGNQKRKAAYSAAATTMAKRISTLTNARLDIAALNLTKAGLKLPTNLVDGLNKRRALLEQPYFPKPIFDWCAPKFK